MNTCYRHIEEEQHNKISSLDISGTPYALSH